MQNVAEVWIEIGEQRGQSSADLIIHLVTDFSHEHVLHWLKRGKKGKTPKGIIWIHFSFIQLSTVWRKVWLGQTYSFI